VAEEVKSLTGLRWFAALAVFLYHFGNPGWLPNFFKNVQLNGLLGVQFFFVLSGYVLATRYFHDSPRPAKFFVARFARIGPMYYVGLFLSVIYYLYQTNHIDLIPFIVHALGLQAWSSEMDYAVSFNGPAWTISVEIFFYALFPLLISLSRRFSRGIVRSLVTILLGSSWGAILILVHIVRYGPLESGIQELPNDFLWFTALPIHYLGLFIAGIGAAHLTVSLGPIRDRSVIRLALNSNALLSGLFAALLFVNFDSAQHPYLAIFVRFSLASIPVGLLLTSLHLNPKSLASKFLGMSPLVFLGRASYAFYIIHMPFIWLVRIAFPNAPYDAQFLMLLGCSALMYLVFERPLRNRLISVVHTDPSARRTAKLPS